MDIESESYCSGSVTDSGRGNSLQEDGSSSTPRSVASPRSNPPQQVFRTESESN